MVESTRFFQTCFGVFQGGGCRGAAFVGAYEEAYRRGVSLAGVAGASAGSIIAALLGAGATPNELGTMVSSLDFRQFLVPPELLPNKVGGVLHSILAALLKKTPLRPAVQVWLKRGLYSSRQIEKWLNSQLSSLLRVTERHVRFSDLPVPTWVIAADLVQQDVKIWSSWTTPQDEVAYAVRCSCSIPGFFQPVNGRYVDGGVLSNLPAFVFQDIDAAGYLPYSTRILAFTLVADSIVAMPEDTQETVRALLNTVVDGSSKVQNRMINNVHTIRVPTQEVRATDFERIDEGTVTRLMDNGRNAARSFFDNELAQIRRSQSDRDLLVGSDEIYSGVVDKLDDNQVGNIWIIDEKTRWLYALYPAVLYWAMKGVRLNVVCQRGHAGDDHEQFRRRLLNALGAQTMEVDLIPFQGFLFDANDNTRSYGVVHTKRLVDGGESQAIRYEAPRDAAVLEALHSKVIALGPTPSALTKARPKLIETTSDELLARLKRFVQPYGKAGVSLSVNRVPIKSLIALSKVVKGYKFHQISYLHQLFLRDGLSPYQLALAQYADGTSTIITPAVAELSGGQNILIQGNTRALFCYKNAINDIDCVVVRNVGVPLPSEQRIPIHHMLIGGRTLSTHDRYGTDIDKDYRQIEFAAHHPGITLK